MNRGNKTGKTNEVDVADKNAPLVDAIETLLGPDISSLERGKFEGEGTLTKSITLTQMRMGEILTALGNHPDLEGKTDSGKRATVRRAISKSGKISKHGDRKGTHYVMLPLDHLRDFRMESTKFSALEKIMMRGGMIQHSDLLVSMNATGSVQTTNEKTDTGRTVTINTSKSAVESALGHLEDEGMIRIQQDPTGSKTYVCTPAVWGHSPSLKKASTFTLSIAAEDLLADAADKLSGSPVEVPGFAMNTPEKMSKSTFVEIAIWHTYNSVIGKKQDMSQ
tara:strand:- start:87 stop:923 length:837 start_codon:yes stop_codon:yes gene_type:complete